MEKTITKLITKGGKSMFGFFNELKFLLRNKATDPVCKMKVDKNEASFLLRNKTKYSSEHKSEKYYFCSENCKNQFDAKPEDFVKENTMGSCCQNKTQTSANKSCC